MMKEEAKNKKKKKKESDQARCPTTVNLRLAFTRWQTFCKIKGCKTETELGFLRLDK